MSSSRPSPKQPQPERLRDWYPYYAGFTNEFAATALTHHLNGAGRILDPWNGTGTTTVVAVNKGARPTGIDINPAMTIVARARLLPSCVGESLQPLAREILAASSRVKITTVDDEPLAQWMRHPAVDVIRRIQHAIHEVLDEDGSAHALMTSPDVAVDRIPLLPSFFYTALFAACRDLLAAFRTANPTWLKFPSDYRRRISPSRELISERFEARVKYLVGRLTVVSASAASRAKVRTGSALSLPRTETFDGAFTSPPYATRLDYVRSTLPELAVLGMSSARVRALRAAVTGTPVVRGSSLPEHELLSPRATRVVESIRTHDTHGSATYYLPWIRNYLHGLEASLRQLDDVVRRDGTIGIIVQDSYYKAVHIDLQSIVTEAFGALGRPLAAREDYPVRHSLTSVNAAARGHLPKRKNLETLLVFKSVQRRPEHQPGEHATCATST